MLFETAPNSIASSSHGSTVASSPQEGAELGDDDRSEVPLAVVAELSMEVEQAVNKPITLATATAVEQILVLDMATRLRDKSWIST